MVSESTPDRPTGDTSVSSDHNSPAQTVHDDTDRTDRHHSATLVTAQLPTEEFALDETLMSVPDLSVDCASLVTAGQTATLPLLWFQTTAPEMLAAALENDSTVTAADALVQTDDRHLYRMEWEPSLGWLCQLLLNSQAILQAASANESHWHVEILYPDRETISQTSTHCEQYNLSFEIESIRTLDPDQTTQYGLTPPQYEALTLACERGYFTVPREVDLEGLAEEIGVSHQALSERLRRGHQTLINTMLGGPGTTLTAAPAAEQSFDGE
jgi:predicted DNA binding protein